MKARSPLSSRETTITSPIRAAPVMNFDDTAVELVYYKNRSTMRRSEWNTEWKSRLKIMKNLHRELDARREKRMKDIQKKKQEIEIQIATIDDTLSALRDYEKQERTRSTTATDIGSKILLQQRKRDALRRDLYFPLEKGYRLRLSMDGIFIGMKDFWLEKFSCEFSIEISQQELVPHVQIGLNGSIVARGHNVKVIGEKGTRVPNTFWGSAFISSNFEGLLAYEFSIPVLGGEDEWEDVLKKGRWKLSKVSKGIDLVSFEKEVSGGIDLPSPLMRMIIGGVATSLTNEFILKELPPEVALVYASEGSTLKLSGEIQIDGPTIKTTIDEPLVSSSETTHMSQPWSSVRHLLGLTENQLNLLVALNGYSISPDKYSLASIADLVHYFNTYIHPYEEDDVLRSNLVDEWQHLIELLYIKRQGDPRGYPMELFAAQDLMQHISQLSNKPVAYRLSLARVESSVDVEKMLACIRRVLIRAIVGLSHGHTKRQSLIYGIRVGRKVQSSRSIQVSEPLQEKIRHVEVLYSRMKQWIETIKKNVLCSRCNIEGKCSGDGTDASFRVTCTDAYYEGPTDLTLSLMPGHVGQVTVKSIRTDYGRIGLNFQIEDALSLTLVDLASKVVIDLDRLVHDQILINAQKLSPKSNEILGQYQVLAAGFSQSEDEKEARGMICGGKFTKWITQMKEGQLETKLSALYGFLTTYLHSCVVDTYYPEHTELFSSVHGRLFKYMCSDSLVFCFAISPSFSVDKSNRLQANIQGIDGHPLPFFHFDEIQLIKVLTDWESVLQTWLEAC